MLTEQTKFFLAFFIGAMVYWRLVAALAHRYLDNPFTRRRLGLRWHHAHYGMLILTTGVVMLLFQELGVVTASLLGLGLGLILDEFVPLLYLEVEDRAEEISKYKDSLKPTVFLFSAVVLSILILTFLLT